MIFICPHLFPAFFPHLTSISTSSRNHPYTSDTWSTLGQASSICPPSLVQPYSIPTPPLSHPYPTPIPPLSQHPTPPYSTPTPPLLHPTPPLLHPYSTPTPPYSTPTPPLLHLGAPYSTPTPPLLHPYSTPTPAMAHNKICIDLTFFFLVKYKCFAWSGMKVALDDVAMEAV